MGMLTVLIVEAGSTHNYIYVFKFDMNILLLILSHRMLQVISIVLSKISY
jgi:hypothetical protein